VTGQVILPARGATAGGRAAVSTAGSLGAELPQAEGGAERAPARRSPEPSARSKEGRCAAGARAQHPAAAACSGCACALRLGEGRRGRASVSDSGRGRGPEMVAVAALPT
jgi:hypothetical protein